MNWLDAPMLLQARRITMGNDSLKELEDECFMIRVPFTPKEMKEIMANQDEIVNPKLFKYRYVDPNR